MPGAVHARETRLGTQGVLVRMSTWGNWGHEAEGTALSGGFGGFLGFSGDSSCHRACFKGLLKG